MDSPNQATKSEAELKAEAESQWRDSYVDHSATALRQRAVNALSSTNGHVAH